MNGWESWDLEHSSMLAADKPIYNIPRMPTHNTGWLHKELGLTPGNILSAEEAVNAQKRSENYGTLRSFLKEEELGWDNPVLFFDEIFTTLVEQYGLILTDQKFGVVEAFFPAVQERIWAVKPDSQFYKLTENVMVAHRSTLMRDPDVTVDQLEGFFLSPFSSAADALFDGLAPWHAPYYEAAYELTNGKLGWKAETSNASAQELAAFIKQHGWVSHN